MRNIYTRSVQLKAVIILLLVQVSIPLACNGETLTDSSSPADNSNGMLGKKDRTIPFQNNTWTNVTTGIAPPPRTGHEMTFDSRRGRIVMFGGGNIEWLNDTWLFDTATGIWTNVTPLHSPPPRTDFKLAYDSESDRVVLFGGMIVNKPGNDTWAYDPGANVWTKMNPKDHPSSCYDYGMAYDSGSDRVVLFGGRCVNYTSRQTWTYDYNRDNWKSMGPSTPPDEQTGVIMTYDSRSDRVILVGGIPWNPPFSPNETWSYDLDHDTWTNITTTVRPVLYGFRSIGYDVRSDRIVLFESKSDDNGTSYTWLYDYDTNSWVNATTSSRVSARDQSAMAYDQVNDRMVVFGGFYPFHDLNDTWTYELSNIPFVTEVSPSNGILDPAVSSDVVISFSELMDRDATERSITLIPQVSMNASWDISGKVLTLSPRSAYEPGMNISLLISVGAKSADGAGLRYDFAFSFVIFKPVPPPTVDAQTVLVVISIATAVSVAIVIALSEWLLYSVLILLLPLYMKIKKEKVLDNFMRGRIYQFIIHCPGAHLRFIKRNLGIEMGVLSYHLHILETSGMIRSVKRGNFKRFFGTKKEGGSGLNEYQSLQKDILNELIFRPGQGIRALSTILNRDRQVVAFCVNDLLDKKALIDKRTVRGIIFQPRIQSV